MGKNEANETRVSSRTVLACAALFLLLHLAAASLFPGRTWGAHHLRYLAPWWWAVWLSVLAAALIPRGRAAIGGAARIADSFIEARRIAGPVLLFACSWLVFFLFRTRNLFLGDGLLVTSVVRNPEETGIGAAGFVSLTIHKGIFAAMEAVNPGAGGAAPFVLTSTLAGACVVLLARAASRDLASGGPARALLFASIILSGGMLLFFGYVEHYSLMQAALLLYLVLAVRRLHGRGSLLAPTAALLAAVLLHASSIVIVPSWFLLLRPGAGGRRRALALLTPAVAAAAAAWGLLHYTERFYRGLDAFLPILEKGDHSYSLLSGSHAAFVANEAFLLFGGALLLPLLLLLPGDREEREGERAVGSFLAVAAALSLLFLLFVDPRLGGRDWDLMALPLFPCLLWLGHAILGRCSQIDTRDALVLAALMLLHSFPWIAVQLDRDRAVAMTVATTINDPHYANPAARAPKSFGLLLAREGYHEQANLFFEKALGLRGDAQNYFNFGTNLARQGKYSEAASFLERAVLADPGYVPAYGNLAACYINLSDTSRAEEVVRRLLAVAPNEGKAYCYLGIIRAEKGEYEEAIRSFRISVDLDPGDDESWARLGVLLAGQGRTGEAKEALLRALEIDPESAEARAALEKIRGEEQDALDYR
ncbi:MAG: tetratricopeptide repeat protein [Candidatus Eisenbacteria bacterium]